MTGPSIAICDDHPVFRAGLSRILREDCGFEIAFEVSTAEALRAALVAHSPKLLLLDMELPDADGLELIEGIVATVPVLVVSAFDEPLRVRAALQGGALGYVRKDAHVDVLVRAIRAALRGKVFVDPSLATRLATAVHRTPESSQLREKIAKLSPRHLEVLALLARGKTTKEIAKELFISPGTAKNHVTKIMAQLGVSNRAKLAVKLAHIDYNGSFPQPRDPEP